MAANGQKADTKTRIVEAAAKLARKQGPAFSTRDVARAVGLTQPSLFHHFKSKAEILHALIERDLKASLLRLQLLAGHHHDPVVELYAYLRLEFSAALTTPIGSVLTHEHDLLEEPGFQDLRVLDHALHAGVEQVYGRALAQGRFVPVAADMVRELISGITIFLFSKADQDGDAAEEHSDAYAALIVRGLLADTEELSDIQQEAQTVVSNVRGSMDDLAGE